MSFETITSDDMYRSKFNTLTISTGSKVREFDKIISENQTLHSSEINNNRVKANSSDHLMDTSNGQNILIFSWTFWTIMNLLKTINVSSRTLC